MAAGWNGVYRSNQKGDFNVPHGSVKSIKVPDREHLRAVATVFKMADIRARSWEATISTARPGDFVFLDPPYEASDRNDLYERGNQFTTYDQMKLAETLVSLQNRGIDFLLTNSAGKSTQEMYRDLGLQVQVIEARRSVSGQVESREVDTEVVVRPNFEATSRKKQRVATMIRIRNISGGRSSD
jgi:DNA adenine methylase